MSAEVLVEALRVGDVAVFVEGDVPFVVVAVSEVVDRVRLLDLVPVRGRRSRSRVTAPAHQMASVVGSVSGSLLAPAETAVAAAV